MIFLIKLILAHLIGDFVLQPKSWVEEKEHLKLKSSKIYLHFLIHGLLVLVMFWSLKYWLLGFWIMIFHGLIDVLKLYAQKENKRTMWFLVDQALHLISILILWSIFFKPEIELLSWFQDLNIWVYITALVFITVVAGILMRELMSKWSDNLRDCDDGSLEDAGKYIGMLERVFVFIFVITANWEGIGFLLAAKSVFRFGDLKDSKDRKLTEYILIGTLLSFGIAVAVGMLVVKLMGAAAGC